MRCLLALTLVVFTVSGASKKPVNVEDIVAQSSDGRILPVWSQDGQNFAYVKNKQVFRVSITQGSAKPHVGKPALWFDLASLSPKQPDDSMPAPFDWRNRRVSTEMLQWLPNNEDILIASENKLTLVNGKGKAQAIPINGPIEDPQISPDGKSVLFRAANNLYVASLASGKSVQLTSDATATTWNGRLDWVYPEELDLGQAAWWSPDSKHIAYFQFDVSDELVYPQADLLGVRALAEPERYPQAGTPNARVRLGIVEAAGGSTVWVQQGNSPDVLMARALWLPDSSAVALETLPRLQNALDLWFCDPSTGASQRILHEQSKTWVNVSDNLYFIKQGAEFLWTSERSGFRHIYRYNRQGTMLNQVTAGDWEVKTIEALTEDQTGVLYTSGEESPLETHLYAVSLAGGARTRITEAGSSHGVHVSPGGQLFIEDASNLTTAPETVLRNMAGIRLITLQARSTKLSGEYELPETQVLTMKGPGGSLLYGRLTKPIGFKAGQRYPLIVAVYGGPGAQSVRNEWQRLGMDQVYAANGYLVWRLDNRGSAGRGHAFEEILYHNLGDAEVADQRAGVEYLVKLGFADPSRVGVTGWSYGGYMTIRCLLQAADVFKIGVAGAPVTDWHNYDTIYTERYLGLPDQQAGAAYAAASNLTIAANLRGKLLLQMNYEDDNVLFQNTVQLVNAFEYANKQYSMQMYPFKTHGVSGELRRPLYSAMLEFFNRNLR